MGGDLRIIITSVQCLHTLRPFLPRTLDRHEHCTSHEKWDVAVYLQKPRNKAQLPAQILSSTKLIACFLVRFPKWLWAFESRESVLFNMVCVVFSKAPGL